MTQAEVAGIMPFLIQPLKDDDDGLRGFEVQDVDGYVLFFGRPVSPILPNNVLQQATSQES